jgi:hypothetical protein
VLDGFPTAPKMFGIRQRSMLCPLSLGFDLNDIRRQGPSLINN